MDDALEREKAQEKGRAIAKRLREAEHDDDWFPVEDIQMICRIVNPYGTDEELQRYLEGKNNVQGNKSEIQIHILNENHAG